MMSSAIFFSYSSQRDFNSILDNLEKYKVDQVILAVGGLPDIESSSGKLNNRRVTLLYEESRLGKSNSFNRAIEHVNGDLTYIISGDVRFEPDIFAKCENRFAENVGMLIPMVEPDAPENFAEHVGVVMWHMRDVFLDYMQKHGRFFSGGEFQAVRNPIKINFKDIVNDDEFLCHHIYSSGLRILYDREIVVQNFVPDRLRELLQQRTRVNFGHYESRKYNNVHSSLSLMIPEDFRSAWNILLQFLKRYPGDTLFIFFSGIIEILSLIMSRRAFRRGSKLNVWKIVNTRKDDP